MESSPEISVVIPVFNSEALLSDLLKEVVTVMNGYGKSFEIICVVAIKAGKYLKSLRAAINFCVLFVWEKTLASIKQLCAEL